MSGVKRALLLSTADRYFALVVNFATVAVVSRIMTPAEVGVSVIGMAIVGIALSLREFASPNYLIQKHSLAPEEIRGAFTAMALVSLTIAASLVVSATVMAGYGEVRLVPYMRVIAAGIILELVPMPLAALMRRHMEFGKLAAVNIAGAGVGAAVTITLALLGFSYMSFAWAWLATAAAMGVVALLFERTLWIYRPSLAGLRSMVVFGGYNGLTVLLYRLYDAVPYLLVGRLVSPGAAALYSRTQMICQLPDKVFLSGAVFVVLPAFAAEARQGRDLRAPYLRALTLITVLQWPALMVLVILAHPIVSLVLGQQWMAAVPLVRIAAIAGLFTFSFELNYPVLVSLGAVRDIVVRALIIFPVSALILAAASLFGLTAAVCGLLLAVPFQAFVSLQFIRRHVAVGWNDIARALASSATTALAAAAGPSLIALLNGASFELSLMQAFAAASLAAAGWLAGMYWTRHPMLDEIVSALASVGLAGRWLPATMRSAGSTG